MKRSIIRIDENKCNGCGQCIPGCPEGALQIIDGKARLVSDLFCDGLGACLNTCPQGAIHVEEREAEPYNEARVMDNIVKQGYNTIKAHLEHLQHDGETKLLEEARAYLQQHNIEIPSLTHPQSGFACPGIQSKTLSPTSLSQPAETGSISSQLTQWPVQLALVNPQASYFDQADLLLSADCTPYAFADFHRRFMRGKVTVTFCPKLDANISGYIEKLAQIFRQHSVRSLTIVRMEVPCCGGIETIVMKALKQAGQSMMVKVHVIGIDGHLI